MNDFIESGDLLRSARDGDREALRTLIGRYSSVLLARIRLMLGEEARRRAESGDFVQDALVELLQDFDKNTFTDERGFLRWLTAVARNNVRDLVRRRRETAWESLSLEFAGNVEPDNSQASPASAAELSEREALLAEALESLSDEYRAVIELRNLDGLSWDEAGRCLERTPEAARKLHARALTQLGRAFESRR